MKGGTYKLSSKLWLYPTEAAAWHFLTIDESVADKIKAAYKGPKRGFGAVKVEVTIGRTSWQTSMFPDKKSGTYLLPVKQKVREAEGIANGDTIDLVIKLI